MVRKVEKAAKDKSPRSVDNSINKKPEHYELTGRFEQDFTSLCAEKSVPYCPAVKPLTQRPTTPWPPAPEPAVSITSKKGKEEKKLGQTPVDSVHSFNDELNHTLGFRPTTFNVTQTRDYFRPKIHIVQEHPDKPETLTEVRIKGWKIGDTLFDLLIKCFSATSKLHTINFWRVGLTDEQVAQLANFLTTNNTVKRLHIDGNEPLGEESLAQLIQDNGSITKLRFRHCCLGPAEAKQMAMRLGTTTSVNTKLLSLDLTGNHIGDEGAVSFAQALRTNRTLLTLSLAQNNIGDIGCKAFAEVLSSYFLTHDEVVQRRVLQSAYQIHNSPTRSSISPSVRRKSRQDITRKDSSRDLVSGTTAKKPPRSGQNRGNKDTDAKEEKSTGRAKKTDSSSSPKKGSGDTTKVTPTVKSRTGRSSRSGKRMAENDSMESSLEFGESSNPLLEKATYVEPYGLRVSGNFVLTMLNLARNRIGPEGASALLDMAEFQQNILTSSTKVNGTGIFKVILLGNAVSETDESIEKLNELLASRDALARSRTQSESLPSPVDGSGKT